VPAPAPPNIVRSFLFEQLDLRGAFVQLNESWRALLAGRDYAAPVRNLLGEMTAVTVLIAANLKQAGRMRFQLQGGGPVRRLLIDCDEHLRLRGIAHADATVVAAAVPDLLGHGQLALSLDVPGLDQPYQSLVPLAGASIGAIFEDYLARSEQQPARLFLAASDTTVAGLFLQKLPGADQRDPDGWERVQILAETVQPHELLELPSIGLLTRLFAEEDIRVFDPRPISYHCPRDPDKITRMLRALGRNECDAILREEGEIHVHDDVCNHDYRFDADAVIALFAEPAA